MVLPRGIAQFSLGHQRLSDEDVICKDVIKNFHLVIILTMLKKIRHLIFTKFAAAVMATFVWVRFQSSAMFVWAVALVRFMYIQLLAHVNFMKTLDRNFCDKLLFHAEILITYESISCTLVCYKFIINFAQVEVWLS